MTDPAAPEQPKNNYTKEEQAQLEALIVEGDELEKKHNFHPAVRASIHEMLAEDGLHWLATMPKETQDRIEGFLTDANKDGTIRKAVWDLLKLATLMDQELKVGKVAYELINILNNTVIKYKLVPGKVKDHDAEFGTERLQGMKDLVGNTVKAGAPKLGEVAPEGSVKADRIIPKRRI